MSDRPVRFDERFLDEIKSRLRLSDVIGRTVKLRRQGREYAGLSPFTKEKSPSFFVNDDKGFYHCFSSGKHGDLISFLQETERLSFPEAVERLANEAGLQMPVQDTRTVEDDRKKQGLSDWVEHAAAWFEGELKRPGGAEARAYLEKRGLPPAEWPKFRLGYAPGGRTALKDYLITKGASPGELVETGLLIAPEEGGAPYDRFRERIIFPITDQRGRVISFGGRALDPNARAKYLNGPETSLFSKSRIVYGLPEARRLLSAGDANAPLVVVEGYMDVIACHRAGIAAVAPMGTALTEEQMELLWRFHHEPTLSFDADNAGQRAAARVVERALPILAPRKSFNFARVDGGKDPDDVLREQGAVALKNQLKHTLPFVQALFEHERDAAGDLETPEKKTALKARLRFLASSIADKDLAQAYKEDLLGRYEALWPTSKPVFTIGAAGRELAKHRWEKQRRTLVSDVTPLGKVARKKLGEKANPLAAALVVSALRDPKVVEGNIETLLTHGLGDPQLDRIAYEIVGLRTEYDAVDAELLRRRLLQAGYEEAAIKRLEENAKIAGAGAPFLELGLPEAVAHELWSQALELMLGLRAFERAIQDAIADLERDYDSSTLMRLKGDRDKLKRSLDSGGWCQPPADGRSLH